MPSLKHLAAAAASTLRCRLSPSLRIRRGGGRGRGRSCTSRCTNQVHEERPKGFAFSRTPPPPTPAPAPSEGQKWEDWELPCYITSFLAVVILGVGFSAKPDDVRIESWAHGRTLERLELESKGR